MRPLRTLSHIPTPTLREASNKHQITEERERSSPRATGPLPSARQFVYPNALLTVRLLQQVSSGRKKMHCHRRPNPCSDPRPRLLSPLEGKIHLFAPP